MALCTFLDIEGAFDNVTFDAIEKALNKKCESTSVNKWIMSMITTRSTTVELNGHKRKIKIKRGCPQGGILSPFLWNLVVDSLLSFTRDKIPCDLQGLADDLALLATLETTVKNGKGFDADTLREVTQKSLNAINEWCIENGLKLSIMKTHSIMFTWKTSWKFSKPLTVGGMEIEMKQSTKFLGVTLDQKLSWNEHIDKQCKKAKGILMQCRRAVGPTWGFTPKTMKWIYTAIVRPALSYGAVIWINGARTKHNIAKLSAVQRLGNILITGALPSTSSTALNKITGSIPIEHWIEEEACQGALRLKANGFWDQEPIISKRGNLTSHIKINNKIINEIPFVREESDVMPTTLNIDTKFEVQIADRNLYEEPMHDENTIHCYTDGSKIESDVGAGVYITKKSENWLEESVYLGTKSTVFQAETYAVGRAAKFLINRGTTEQDIIIHCDCQPTIMAVDNTKIKSKTTLETIVALNTLGEQNNVLLEWIPAHSGYEGNEKVDSLAKKGASNQDSSLESLPIPKVIWNEALRKRTLAKTENDWGASPPSHIKRVWRDKFTKEIPKLNRKNLRIATQLLSGHAVVNYHLNKYKPNSIPKTCPHCLAEEETLNHHIGQCPKWSAQRGALFESFYMSLTDIVDSNSLSNILHVLNSTRRLSERYS